MNIIDLIEQQSPFIQGLIASAIFGITVWLLRVILKKSAKSGVEFLNAYQEITMLRHLIYKDYVKSDDIYKYTQGFNFVVLQILRWFLIGVLIVVFFLGVNAILNSQWVWAICSWFAFNSFFEAYQWSKDSSDEKTIKNINEDIKNEFLENQSSDDVEAIKNRVVE